MLDPGQTTPPPAPTANDTAVVSTATPLDAALGYASIGWRVVPIPPGSKHPAVKAWQKAGTTDTDRISHWWTNAPGDGIGILTGPESGIWVLDIDTSGDKRGDDSLAELTDAYGPLPDTYEVVTGSGGRHLYFTWPTDGTVIRNNQSGKLGAGIDVRGVGGQVLAPPTIHPNGTPYAVEASAPTLVAAAPPWLIGLLNHEPERRPTIAATPTGDRPGDIWAAATSWHDLLIPDGWTHSHTSPDGEDHWTRPGKEKRKGTSATTGYKGSGVLKVFTSSLANLTAEETYTKLGYLAATRFGGDHSAAASSLRNLGHGATADQGPSLGDLIADATPTTPKQRALAAALPPPAEPWPEPRGLPAVEQRPPFPVHTLPAWIINQVDNVTRQLMCDPMLPALFALGALSVASLGHIRIAVRAGQVERSTGLYLAASGPPASGKSPALSAMFGPVRAHEKRLIEQCAEAVARAGSARKVAQKVADKAADMASSTGDPDDLLTAQNLAAEAEAIEDPPAGEMMTSDITPERLASLMVANSERMAVVSDESGVLDVDRYGDKGGAKKLDIYLQAFTGEPVVVHRVKAPTVRLAAPLMAVCAGVQPEALAAAMADWEWRTRGMGARFLTATTTQLARNTDIDLDLWDSAVGDRYDQSLGHLARDWASWATPATLTIAPEARRAFSAWAAALQEREDGGDLEGESGWVSKMRTSTIRIAALLHLADGAGHNAPISADAMERAIEIGEYFAASHIVEADGSSDDARRLLRSLVKLSTGQDPQKGQLSRATNGFVARREVARRGSRGMRTLDEITMPLISLLEAGLVRLVGDADLANMQVSDAIKRCKGFQPHPDAVSHTQKPTPRDTARQTPGESNEMTREAKSVGHVGHVAYRGSPDPLTYPQNANPPESSAPPRDMPDTFCLSCYSTHDDETCPPTIEDPTVFDLPTTEPTEHP